MSAKSVSANNRFESDGSSGTLNDSFLYCTRHLAEILDCLFLAQLHLSALDIIEPNFCSCQIMKYRFLHHVVTEFHAA